MGFGEETSATARASHAGAFAPEKVDVQKGRGDACVARHCVTARRMIVIRTGRGRRHASPRPGRASAQVVRWVIGDPSRPGGWRVPTKRPAR